MSERPEELAGLDEYTYASDDEARTEGVFGYSETALLYQCSKYIHHLEQQLSERDERIAELEGLLAVTHDSGTVHSYKVGLEHIRESLEMAGIINDQPVLVSQLSYTVRQVVEGLDKDTKQHVANLMGVIRQRNEAHEKIDELEAQIQNPWVFSEPDADVLYVEFIYVMPDGFKVRCFGDYSRKERLWYSRDEPKFKAAHSFVFCYRPSLPIPAQEDRCPD